MADMMQNPNEQQSQQIEGLPANAVPIQGLPANAVPMGQQAQPTAQPAVQPKQGESGTFVNPMAQGGADLLTGAAKGLGDTVHGIGSLIHKGVGLVSPKAAEALVPEQGSKALDAMTTPQGVMQKIGFGGETLAEFLLGDEALKGMSLAEKMANSAKVMQILEKFPRVLDALKMGANVGKAQEALGPEERALLQKYPVLARLVSHGMDAIRQGVVQAGQTTAKTGSVEEGAKEGATMTGVSAALGAPLSLVGGEIAKGGQAAKTVQQIGKMAEAAPEKTEVAEMGGNMLTQAEKKMHTDFESGIQKIKGLIGDEEIPLKGSPFQKTAEEILQSGEGAHPLERLAGETAPVSDFAKKYIKGVSTAFEKAEPGVAEGAKADPLLVDALGREGGGVATATKEAEEPVTVGIDNLIKARQTLGERLRGLGYDSAADRADRAAYSRMIDGIDDTIEKLAQRANPGDHTKYMKDAIESIAPGKQLGDLTTQELSQVAQKAAEIQRTTSPSGLYEQIRNQYRTTKKLFDDPEARRAVNSIMNGNLDDLGKQLTTGTKSGHVIDTVRKLIGDDNMNKLSDNVFQTWIKDAATTTDKEGNTVASQFDPDKLLRKWVSLKPNVRSSLFQMTPERAKSYSQFISSVQDTASFKKLVKYGLLPAGLGTAGVVHGPLAALVGAVAGAGIESFGRARDILDSIANNPRTWNTVAKIAGGASSKAAGITSTAAKVGAAKVVNTLGARGTSEKAKEKVKGKFDQEVSPLRQIFHGAAAPLSSQPAGFVPTEQPVTPTEQPVTAEEPQPEAQPQ